MLECRAAYSFSCCRALLIMVEQVTKGIRVSVDTYFEGSFTKEGVLFYAFGYKVSITNNSEDTVQLLSRSWDIYDALNIQESSWRRRYWPETRT